MDVFYDKADAMKHHPFMDFIDALFPSATRILALSGHHALNGCTELLMLANS